MRECILKFPHQFKRRLYLQLFLEKIFWVQHKLVREKTLCYGIACINKLLNDKGSNALIICPTRELAVQVGDVLNGLIENTMNIKSAVLIGGESMQKQLRQLRKRPRLIIGTPGRLNDQLKKKKSKIASIIIF